MSTSSAREGLIAFSVAEQVEEGKQQRKKYDLYLKNLKPRFGFIFLIKGA